MYKSDMNFWAIILQIITVIIIDPEWLFFLKKHQIYPVFLIQNDHTVQQICFHQSDTKYSWIRDAVPYNRFAEITDCSLARSLIQTLLRYSYSQKATATSLNAAGTDVNKFI